MTAPNPPHYILDVLKEIKNLKIGQKWTVIVTPMAEGMEGYPAKLERLPMLHLIKMISRGVASRHWRDSGQGGGRREDISTLRSLRLCEKSYLIIFSRQDAKNAKNMEGYPAKLERLLMLHLVKMISRRAVLRQAQDRAENAEKIFSTLRSLRL